MGKKQTWGYVVLLLCGLQASPVWAQTRIDLQVESIEVNQSRSVHNRKVEIVTAVRNNGTESAENVYLEIEIRQNGKRMKTIQEIPVLASLPRSGVTRSLPVSAGILAEGTYQAVVRVDPANVIQEINESNNSDETEFRVQRPVGSY